MKTTFQFSLILILLIGISCKKNKTENQQNADIILTQINKSIIGVGEDSISGFCKAIIFEISSYSPTKFNAQLTENTSLNLCDGFNTLVLDSSNYTHLFNENELISSGNTWGAIKNINLANFAGKGEKYLGFKLCSFPSGILFYHFGWIKIDLSKNCDTLNIISQAINYADNQSIRAGQMK